ncbi:sensor histidine kinase [Actinotalea ferrariae]|uniref:sensor histidine kinase n=1 Tax=Actinotalea ferrariae TaxID=1386098 RepID=UPI001C8B68F1|nr:sensor histidine kinase [Actinotalea ferrariae]MBX9246594.1 sensor histidine kinase [Actinotalea ferrariae]
MTTVAPAPASAPGRSAYRHQAFLWDSVEHFLDVTVPFVREGLDRGEPVMVALVAEQWAPLRTALGRRAQRVLNVDMAELGRNPARIIPAWSEFVAAHEGYRVRGIGGPVWAGRRPAELVEAQIHEAMLNLAVPHDTALWLLCPYDARTLPPEVLAAALRHHPEVTAHHGPAPSAAWAGVDRTAELETHPLPEPTGPVEELAFAAGLLSGVRRVARAHAADAGLPPGRADDLALAVSELASNSIDHGGGGGVLRAWRDDEALVLEVSDHGRLADPLVGRRAPTPDQERGRGLWMVNRLCDLVQMRTTGSGTVVRVVTWL